MREIRLSGSEGGVALPLRRPYPYQVFSLGVHGIALIVILLVIVISHPADACAFQLPQRQKGFPDGEDRNALLPHQTSMSRITITI